MMMMVVLLLVRAATSDKDLDLGANYQARSLMSGAQDRLVVTMMLNK